jgi:hypothetical protein
MHSRALKSLANPEQRDHAFVLADGLSADRLDPVRNTAASKPPKSETWTSVSAPLTALGGGFGLGKAAQPVGWAALRGDAHRSQHGCIGLAQSIHW